VKVSVKGFKREGFFLCGQSLDRRKDMRRKLSRRTMGKGTLFSPSHKTSSLSILKRGNKTVGKKIRRWFERGKGGNE